VLEALLVCSLETGGAGAADGGPAAVVFVVGGDIADGGVQAHGVVLGAYPGEVALQGAGVVDGLQDRVIVYSRTAATDPRPRGMATLLGGLLATTFVVVFMAVLVGIRAAAAHERSGESYELTARRIASSLSVCLLVVSAALSTISTPSPGAIAATHVANVALFVSVGWWLWTLRVDGVLAVPPVSLAKKREATAAPRPRQDSETPRTPRPSPPKPEEGQG
jgi:hypothetical protein